VIWLAGSNQSLLPISWASYPLLSRLDGTIRDLGRHPTSPLSTHVPCMFHMKIAGNKLAPSSAALMRLRGALPTVNFARRVNARHVAIVRM